MVNDKQTVFPDRIFGAILNNGTWLPPPHPAQNTMPFPFTLPPTLPTIPLSNQ